jgi:hypothetical protein
MVDPFAARKKVSTESGQLQTLTQLQHMANTGYDVVYEHTSTSQDVAMKATADQLKTAASKGSYTGWDNNCDLFAAEVLSAGDPKMGAAINTRIPRQDMVNLIYQGMTQLFGTDPETTSQSGVTEIDVSATTAMPLSL